MAALASGGCSAQSALKLPSMTMWQLSQGLAHLPHDVADVALQQPTTILAEILIETGVSKRRQAKIDRAAKSVSFCAGHCKKQIPTELYHRSKRKSFFKLFGTARNSLIYFFIFINFFFQFFNSYLFFSLSQCSTTQQLLL